MPNNLWSTNDIVDEQYRNSLEYGIAVNTDRALPNAVDGLKPVVKRSLYDMWETGTDSSKPHKKSARVVGDTMGKFHPHGQDSIYGAIVRLAQPWVLRYPLVDGHGNFGNIGGDGPAAMRYSEVRLTKLAEDGLLAGLKKKNVDFGPNYDDTEDEPISLPAIFPNLLCNPNEGIGWALSCSWAANNLREVAQAIFDYIDGKEPSLPGPDFPTGGTVLVKPGEIETINKTGHGTIKIQANYIIENQNIIFTEIPYGTRIEPLMKEIGEASDANLIPNIEDIRNESNKKGVRLVVEIEKGINPNSIIEKLFEKTNLRISFSYNQMALVDKTPTELNLKNCCKIYTDYNIKCIIKEANYDLQKANARLHILNGLLTALEDIDNIINLIKKSSSSKEAKDKLIEKYSFTEEQAKAILSMKLASLANLEKIELQNEKTKLTELVEKLNALINNIDNQKIELKKRLQIIVDKYGDNRRTKIVQLDIKPKAVDKEVATVEPEKCVVIMTENGSIKRIPTASFKVQKRNGKGVKTQDDITNSIIRTNTVDTLMIFTNQGRMYRLLVDKIPVGTNTSKGVSAASLVNMLPNEKPVVIYSIYKDTNAKFIFFCTKKGLVKKVPLTEYQTTGRKSGSIQATKIKEDDELCYVSLINDESVALFTKTGMGLRFKTTDLPISSRIAIGVKGITLTTDDEVIQATVVRENDNIALFTRSGMCKQISQNELMVQNRGGKGLMCYKNNLITGAISLAQDDSVLVVGDKKSICLAAKDITIASRASTGVPAINASNITSVSKI